MIVRRRSDEDIPGCVRALELVHALNGYPTRWPANPAAWLRPDGCEAAWVVADLQQPDTIIGHACVIRGVDDPVVASLTGATPDHLASVSRLFVAPAARGRGLGATLLAALSSWSAERDLHLMLDVVDDGGPAVALYERLGWRLVDQRLSDWVTAQGERLPMRSYLAPENDGRGPK
jgi:GNAT superfamily N-acetyltransferase